MAIARTVITSFVAKTQNFVRGVNKSTESLGKFNASTKIASATVGQFSSLIAAAFSVSTIRNVFMMADQLDKASIRLGVNVEQLQRLQFISKQSGISVQTLEMALQRMTRRLGEASKGTGEARKTLEELGLASKELIEVPVNEQFDKIINRLSKMENNALKVAAAQKIFDSEGVRLVQIANLSSDALGKLNDEFADMDKLTRDATTRLVEAGDEINRVIISVKNSLGLLISDIIAIPGKTESSFNKVIDFLRQMPGLEKIAALNFAKEMEEKFGPTIDKVSKKTAMGMDKIGKTAKKAKMEVDRFNAAIRAFAKNQESDESNRFQIDRGSGNRFAITERQNNLEGLGRFTVEIPEKSKEIVKAGDDIGNAFANAFESIITGATSAKEAIRSLATEILTLTARKAIIDPLSSQLAGGVSSLTSSVAGRFGTSTTQAAQAANRSLSGGTR